jgi:hypothetical protein
MGTLNVLTLPEYYYLYALFFDYPLNNVFHIDREERAKIREMLSTIQRWLDLRQPYRKDFRLRLFTERESLARWSPDLVDEALRQLKQTVGRLRDETARRDPNLHRRREREAAPPTEEAAAWPVPGSPPADNPPPAGRYLLTA